MGGKGKERTSVVEVEVRCGSGGGSEQQSIRHSIEMRAFYRSVR